ncbi:MAG: aromatic ring-hydroxylating dioxygenase subunit alpha [Betaproteobacteria bacterium]|nr:aromatic ring-hydroxylating dioxygenase subunit alpha [Betaproteobacteria bacterium]
MTDLSSTLALTRTPVPLPISWYFDPEIARLEQKLIFDAGPGYIGHEHLVPNTGDYYVLDWLPGAPVLVRGKDGIRLLSNVCRHRQSLLLSGHGNRENIVCPVHRWTYDLAGTLLGAPQFPNNPCLNLEATNLRNWRGLLFTGQRDPEKDLAGMNLLADYDYAGHLRDRVEISEYPFNWKTFLEIYLELYHVEAVHPGLRQFVDPSHWRWEFGEWWSSQQLGIYKNLAHKETPAYGHYIDELLKYRNGELPKYGTLWSMYYPNICLEWYPHCLVISTILPRGPDKCLNVVEFYYPEEVALFERTLVEAHQAAYFESAAQDQQICEHLHEGRRKLYASGQEQQGPYLMPAEDGMIHFHEFVRGYLEPALGQAS